MYLVLVKSLSSDDPLSHWLALRTNPEFALCVHSTVEGSNSSCNISSVLLDLVEVSDVYFAKSVDLFCKLDMLSGPGMSGPDESGCNLYNVFGRGLGIRTVEFSVGLRRVQWL